MYGSAAAGGLLALLHAACKAALKYRPADRGHGHRMRPFTQADGAVGGIEVIQAQELDLTAGPLTGDLQESQAAPASDHLSDHHIADPRVAQGTYAINYDATLFILHPDDVPGTALHPDSGRRGGCCGLHGQDGPNLVCADCGAEVATKESDCWTDNLVALIAAAVVSSTEPPAGTR